jgi:hypothetical protein
VNTNVWVEYIETDPNAEEALRRYWPTRYQLRFVPG